MIEPERGVTSADLESWRRYIGREETRHELLDRASLCRFAAAVGSPLEIETHLPPLAHWAYFHEVAASHQLGPDGHKQRGEGLIPPIHLPRRMFAGASMRFIEPLIVGQEASLRLRLAEVSHKSSARGDLVFVEVDRRLLQSGATRVAERQTIVYRCAGARLEPVEPTIEPASRGEETWIPDTVELFRFSAVTFNAHRIHYDLPYTQTEEGYPNLIVHGPLTAAKLFTFAQKRLLAPLSAFDFRVNAPLFAKQPVRLRAGRELGQFEAVRCDGVVAISAQASP